MTTTTRRLTDEQIERRVAAMFDALDHAFMTGPMTQEEYDARAKEIAAWADDLYYGPGGLVAA